MDNVMIKVFMIVAISVCGAKCLNVLVVLPCYGGHFGAMASVIQLLSVDNHVTVIMTSPLCDNKLISVQRQSTFDIISEDLIFGHKDLNSQWEFLMNVGPTYVEVSQNLTAYLDVFLSKNKEKFDVIICDTTNLGVLLSAETFDMPVIISCPGISLGVEHGDEKHETSVFEAFVNSFAMDCFVKYIAASRRERKLPELVSQNDLIPFEYYSRFPSIIYTSPSFYPRPHESAEYIFIGGYRNDSISEPLSSALLQWLNLDSLDVVYLSMGTNVNFDGRKIQEFANEIKKQKQYRVIWSLSPGMQKTVDQMSLTSDSLLYFSNFLPQYTLLGHPKVKIFVTHGGLLSSVDVIKRKKPSICVPHLGDQFYNCRKMASWRTSEQVDDFTFGGINDAIVKILDNYDAYMANTDKIGDDFSKYEDVESLNEFVAKIAGRKKTTIIKQFQFQLYSDKLIRAWMVVKVVVVLLAVAVSFLVFKGITKLVYFKKRNGKPKQS